MQNEQSGPAAATEGSSGLVKGESTEKVVSLCELPRIVVIEGFLSDEECEHLIQISKEKLERSLGFDLESGENKKVSIRTSWHCWLPRRQDETVTRIESRIAGLTGIPPENGEDLSILRYQIGQEYKAHHDYFDPQFAGSSVALGRGGQRRSSVLLYLSDVEEGGETFFPLLNIAVSPKRGRLLWFENVRADGSLEPKSLHAGMPVKAGEKWLATKWLREGPFC